jgi:hypothetical protein
MSKMKSSEKMSDHAQINKGTLWVIALAISLTISVYCCESILRLFFIYPKPIANYYPFHAAKLGQVVQLDLYEFKTEHAFNSSGFREREFSVKGPAGAMRILFVGDSFTEGFGVEEIDRFSNVAINNLGNGFEGVNIGQLATNPNHYFDNLKKFGLALNPDLVVMGVFLGNDFMGGGALPLPDLNGVNQSMEFSRGIDAVEFLSASYIRALLDQVVNKRENIFYRWAGSDLSYWDIYFRQKQKVTKRFHADNLNLSEADLDMATAGFNRDILREIYGGRLNTGMFRDAVLHRLGVTEKDPYYSDADYYMTQKYIIASKNIVEKAGKKFLVVILPDINQVHHNEFYDVFRRAFLINSLPSRLLQLERLHERLRSDFVKNGVWYIDPTKQLKNNGPLTYYLYDNHMNPLGHKIVGELLAREIRMRYIH